MLTGAEVVGQSLDPCPVLEEPAHSVILAKLGGNMQRREIRIVGCLDSVRVERHVYTVKLRSTVVVHFGAPRSESFQEVDAAMLCRPVHGAAKVFLDIMSIENGRDELVQPAVGSSKAGLAKRVACLSNADDDLAGESG